MAEYILTEKENITNVANAVRGKTGSTSPMSFNGMAAAVTNLSTESSGGTVTTNIDGILKGDGNGNITAAIAGTDYMAPVKINATDDGKIMTAASGKWVAASPKEYMPKVPVASTDNGKVLTVVDGTWAAVTPAGTSGGSDVGSGPFTINVTTSAGASVIAEKGETTISGLADENGSCTLTVNTPGTWTIRVELEGMTKTTTIEAGAYPITMPLMYENFADNSWDNIIACCQNNTVPDSWKVGDQKEMQIDGVTYHVDIIGKYHDEYADGSRMAPLTLQLHEVYGVDYPIYNTNNVTNINKFYSTYMYTSYLPSFVEKLPANVQNGLKSVKKNYGGTSKSDIIFLLSIMELFGTTVYSDNIYYNSASETYLLEAENEGNQYIYYKTNTKVKKSLENIQEYQWLRTWGYTGSYYCAYSFDTTVEYVTRLYSQNYKIAPAFCF